MKNYLEGNTETAKETPGGEAGFIYIKCQLQ